LQAEKPVSLPASGDVRHDKGPIVGTDPDEGKPRSDSPGPLPAPTSLTRRKRPVGVAGSTERGKQMS